MALKLISRDVILRPAPRTILLFSLEQRLGCFPGLVFLLLLLLVACLVHSLLLVGLGLAADVLALAIGAVLALFWLEGLPKVSLFALVAGALLLNHGLIY